MNKFAYNELKETIYTHTLSNGLKVILAPKKDYNHVCAYFTTKFGGAYHGIDVNGTKLLSGLAHFLEHRLFDNPKGEVMDLFDSYGAAYCNAYTSFDITTFIFKSSVNINKCVNLLLDFVQMVEFTKERVDNEKKIITQEYHMGDDKPNSKLFYGLFANSLVKYPFNKKVIGTLEDIANTTKEDLYLAHDTFYHPKNMYLVIVGAFSPKQMLNLIEKNQKSKEFKEVKSPRIEVVEPKKVNKEYEELNLGLPYYKVGVTYKFDSKIYQDKKEKVKDSMIYEMIYKLLFGASSPLAESLLKENIVNNFIEYDAFIEDGLNMSMFVADCNDKDKFINKLDQIINNPTQFIQKESFMNAKRKNYSKSIKELDNPEDYADRLMHAYKDEILYLDYFEIAKSITFEEIIEKANSLKNHIKSVYVIH